MGALPPLHPKAANSLMMAVVVASSAPLLLLDGELCVIAASASFCQAFAIDPISVVGKTLAEQGNGEWNIPQLEILLQATASGSANIEAYEMDLKRASHATRRLVLNVQRINYGPGEEVRLVLAVSDVTEARIAEKLKDDLLGEKAVLLKELQHRIANSLQIISSVLLQSARKVQSEETRYHLFDAHSRVMSVAALQQHLAASQAGDVDLHTYFTDLCKSIGASMIRDPNQLSLKVDADSTRTEADISVSLGLIVTELVINALKHAFPNDQHGQITVGYHAQGKDWTLSVGDDGIGMPKNADDAKPGLGSGIVEALSRQLNSSIAVTDAKPGTLVSVRHEEAAPDIPAPPAA